MELQLIFDKARALGIHELEVCRKGTRSSYFKIFEGSLEDYTQEEQSGLSVRGIHEGRMGYSYTEKLEAEAIDELLENLIQYAEINDSSMREGIVTEAPIDIQKAATRCLLSQASDEEKIEYLKTLEKLAFSADPRIAVVEGCSLRETTAEIFIKNTNGIEHRDRHSFGVLEILVVAKDKTDTQTGFSSIKLDELSLEKGIEAVHQACSDAVMLLGAQTLESRNYPVILRNNVSSDLFETMSRIFFGDVVQMNLSLIKNRLGEKIASGDLNILEDPLLEAGTVSRSFDDEGSRTNPKYIVEQGVLKTFLHNKRTAGKAGLESTGNGLRQSYKTSIETLPTNLYIRQGSSSLEDMIKSIKCGVMVIDVQGLHAGINPVSGDFSLLANGFLIEDGVISRPLKQFTIAGNFYTLIHEISEIGNDLIFSTPGSSNFGAPSLLVPKLTVSSK